MHWNTGGADLLNCPVERFLSYSIDDTFMEFKKRQFNYLRNSNGNCKYLVHLSYLLLNMKIVEKENASNQFEIELTPEVAQGVYANLAIITHSSSEFILDFVRILPGIPKGGVKSRVILAPEHAKRLLGALQENIAKYENQFGAIKIPDRGKTYIPPISDFKGEA